MHLTTVTPILLLPLLVSALPQADEAITTTKTSTRVIMRTLTATQATASDLPLVALTEPAPQHTSAIPFPDISLSLETASVPTDILVAPPSSTRSSTSSLVLATASAGTVVPFPATTATGGLPSGTGSAIVTASPIATFTGAATRHMGGSAACVGVVLALASVLVGACM